MELPEAKYNLDVGSGTHAEETGKMLIGIEKVLKEEKKMVLEKLYLYSYPNLEFKQETKNGGSKNNNERRINHNP